MPEDNREVPRLYSKEVINKGDLSFIDKLYSKDLVYHSTDGGEIRGLDSVKEHVQMFRTAFPDIHVMVEDVFAEGDKVVNRWSMSGTHKGELMGIPPTGNQVGIWGISILRFIDGKVVEIWDAWDNLSFMKQIGVSS
jgi:steroid delta-isomerase-like uncharacterized protein